ncbi:MAPEG family protein [Sphingobium bisphenolivorans]|uniref:MAPEG family protein n=1 Tax=Sphingobium bisphenolivorans TaxID=1335760 RepID=UPI00039EDBD2|nr:MAPEG family protein [Sphingobium bisphenolivorans]
MLLPITLTLAAACAFLNLWLASRCVRVRMGAKLLHGDGGNSLMGKRMRAHANFAEYTPIILILFGLVELALGPSNWLWGAALLYVLARIGHGFGMDRDAPNPWRAGGALLTWAVMVGLAVAALLVAYQATRVIPAPPALAVSD